MAVTGRSRCTPNRRIFALLPGCDKAAALVLVKPRCLLGDVRSHLYGHGQLGRTEVVARKSKSHLILPITYCATHAFRTWTRASVRCEPSLCSRRFSTRC